jgi:glycosidase
MRKTLLYLFCLLISHSGFAQDPAQYGTPFTGVPDVRDAVIYQVNTRAFSSTHNFQGVINRLTQIRALGTNVLYLMPHYPVGVLNGVNSPYSIRDFQAVGTEFGSLADLRRLVDSAHAKGMAVMIDWVVNQTSWDHAWITQHPDWYLHDANGNITSLNGWTDVAALNLASSGMRTAMINAMRYWVFTANIDGFRCDYADNPPIDFWQQTITSLRSITTHKLLLLAEGARTANYTAGFDYNFGMQFYYNSLKPIFTGASATAIDNSNNVEYQDATGNQQVTRYLTNHDVNGAEGTPLQLFGGKAGSMAAFVVATYMKGVPFIYNGQEVAFPTQIPFPFTSVTIDWTINPDVLAEYKKVIGLRVSSNAIRRGTLASYTNNDVCVFTKTSGTEKVLVFSNFRNATINYTLPTALANTTWKNAYTGETVTLGTTRSLTAYQYLVLTNADVPVVPVTGISISPATVSIPAGTTTQLSPVITPANATNQSTNWTSNNIAVATVSNTGLVTTVAAGTAVITATTVDQHKTATATVTVTPSTNFTVWFYKPASWGTGIKIYWWDALPAGVLANGNWPGVNMNTTGDGWYSYTFINITSTNLIFNDGTNQTGNLTRNKTGWYLNDVWYDSKPVVPPTGTTYYQIVNRWQATSYLYDAGNGQVRYGTNPSGNAYQWQRIDAGAGYVQLKNRATGNYIHVENQNGAVQSGPITLSWYSAMWAVATATDGWSYLQNRWLPAEWINLEGLQGYAQYTGAEAGWYSAMWKFVNPVTVAPSIVSQAVIPTVTYGINIYPNPSNGEQFSVSGIPKNELVTISIFDSNGKLVYKRQSAGSVKIEHHLPPGLYIVNIASLNINTSKKLIVQ